MATMSMKAILFLWMLLLESGSQVTAQDGSVNNIVKLDHVINDFSIQLYKELAKSNPNLICSGYGVTTTLNMLLAGANTTTEKELMDVLGYTAAGLTKQETQAAYHDILRSQRHHHSYNLDVTNKVIIRSGVKVLPQYRRTLRNVFYSREEVTNATSIRDANSLSSSPTDKTPNNLDAPVDHSTLDLVSAMFLNATWQHQFNKSLTAPHPFHNGKKTKDIPFMNTVNDFKYFENEDLQVLELAYRGNDLDMVIILPRAVSGLPDLEKNLSSNTIVTFIRATTLTRVHVQIPRFTSFSSLKLSDVLKNLGMINSFTPCADLTGIETRRGLHVTEVIQRAEIGVTEDGTVSASDSATRVKRQVHYRARPIQFTADRPFFYSIFHRPSGVVLFLGKMSEV